MAKFNIDLKKGDIIKTGSDLIVGIDLGTTNSLVAYINGGKAEAVAGPSGKNVLLPSVVHFPAEGAPVVGEEARDKLLSDPGRTIYSVKRLMGKSYRDVSGFDQYFGYTIVDEDEESLVKIKVDDKFYTPIALSALILKSLKARIESTLGGNITKAVITVPAYFNDAQRQATRDAGKLAGLDVLRIVNEPTAASLAYGIGLDPAGPKQTVAVYDLGGGTFDISILSIENGLFEVLSTNGDTFLGGDDIDRAIIGFWLSENGIGESRLERDKSFGQALRLGAERAKKDLSQKDGTLVSIDGQHFSLDRSRLEALVKPLIDRTLTACRHALADAGLAAPDIDQVILVGGSTRMPAIKEAVTAFFGRPAHDQLDPDQVVALGAAIQADVLAGNQKDVLLLDITPLSLGIETVGGLMDVIIPRNSKVPTKVGRRYTTSVDGQRNLKVAVYQGERDLVEHNRKLGEFILKDIPPMAAGLPKIEVQFYLDADGILKVRAEEQRSGVEQAIVIRSQYGVSEEEMARMLLDSLAHAGSDMAARALLEARNEANSLLIAAGRFIDQNRSWLSESQVKAIRALGAELKAATEGNDKDAINLAIHRLNEYTNPLAHEALDRNVAEAYKGKNLE
jgi:molecular chaperone HscA